MTIRTSTIAIDRPRHRRLHSDFSPKHLGESVLVVNNSIVNNEKHHRRWASASNAPVDLCLAGRAAEEPKMDFKTRATMLTTDCLLSWVDLNSSGGSSNEKKVAPTTAGNDTSFVVSRATASTRILPSLARSSEGIAKPPVISHMDTGRGVTRPKTSSTDRPEPLKLSYHTNNGSGLLLTEPQRPAMASVHAPVNDRCHRSQEKYHPTHAASLSRFQDSGPHESAYKSIGPIIGERPHRPQPQHPETHSSNSSSKTMAATLLAAPSATPILAPLSPTRKIQSLMESVVHVVESVHEQHRRAQHRKRISQTLLTLRAAAEVQRQWEQQQQQQDHAEGVEAEQAETTPLCARNSSSEELDLSDLGSALFCPLMDPVLLKGHLSHAHYELDSPRLGGRIATSASDTNEEDSRINSSRPLRIDRRHPYDQILADHHDEKKIEDNDFRPVHILPELNSNNDNPRILSDVMFQQLITDGVPESLHINAWERIYSMGRDGDSFRTLLDRCTPYQYSIMVVQTTSGYLLGGFVSEAWQEQHGFHQKHSYYGTGVSFLFASHPATSSTKNNNADDKDDKPLSIFPWTGHNDFCQICDMERNVVAMGGSGAFGFILEDNLYRGSTDHCGTFDNPPLTPDKDGIFTVAAMEVYGLVPLFEKPSHHNYCQECPTGSSPRSTVLSVMASAMIDHLHQ